MTHNQEMLRTLSRAEVQALAKACFQDVKRAGIPANRKTEYIIEQLLNKHSQEAEGVMKTEEASELLGDLRTALKRPNKERPRNSRSSSNRDVPLLEAASPNPPPTQVQAVTECAPRGSLRTMLVNEVARVSPAIPVLATRSDSSPSVCEPWPVIVVQNPTDVDLRFHQQDLAQWDGNRLKVDQCLQELDDLLGYSRGVVDVGMRDVAALRCKTLAIENGVLPSLKRHWDWTHGVDGKRQGEWRRFVDKHWESQQRKVRKARKRQKRDRRDAERYLDGLRARLAQRSEGNGYEDMYILSAK